MQVLLVEDDKDLAFMVKKRLEALEVANIEVIVQGSLNAATTFLYAAKPDVILLDLGLPDSKGLETFRYMREAADDSIAIVVISATDNRDVVVKSLREGAQDYIVKGKTDPYAIASILQKSIETHVQDMKERQKQEEEIARQIEMLESVDSDDPVEKARLVAKTVARNLRSHLGSGEGDPVS